MTHIKIYRDKNRNVVKYKVYGHSGYEKEGSDIVCAAISSIAQTAALGLIKIAGIAVRYEIDEAYFECVLPYDMRVHDREKADIILETMILGIQQFEDQYRQYIRMLEVEV